MKRVKFFEDILEFDIVAEDDRFMICTRALDRYNDEELLQHEVNVGAYLDIDSAFEQSKDSVVYTIVDHKHLIRGTHNWILDPYDLTNHENMIQLLADLNSGECELSRRTKIPLHIERIHTTK